MQHRDRIIIRKVFSVSDFSGNVPCVLDNDGFMSVRKYHLLVRRCGSALLRLEILTDGLAQYGMTEVFLSVKDISNRSCVPAAGVFHTFVSAILRIVQGGKAIIALFSDYNRSVLSAKREKNRNTNVSVAISE